jgi:SAM-dependent methyltransferase
MAVTNAKFEIPVVGTFGHDPDVATHDWNDHYMRGELPWDAGEPDVHLVDLVRAGIVGPGRALEIGSGTGTNALWLAAEGFDVLGIDVSERAVEMASAKAGPHARRVTFATHDFLADTLAGPFDFVFDRGCFHVFDEAEQRRRFAQHVAAVLRPDGLWLSLIGSTEGPAREHGPPRRSAIDIVTAVEPFLEVVSLRGEEFDAGLPTAVRAWVCLARRRTVPAQPSTRGD